MGALSGHAARFPSGFRLAPRVNNPWLWRGSCRFPQNGRTVRRLRGRLSAALCEPERTVPSGVDYAILKGASTLRATINNFGAGDQVDFEAVKYASTDTVRYARRVVTVDNSRGAKVASFDVSGSYTGGQLRVERGRVGPSSGQVRRPARQCRHRRSRRRHSRRLRYGVRRAALGAGQRPICVRFLGGARLKRRDRPRRLPLPPRRDCGRGPGASALLGTARSVTGLELARKMPVGLGLRGENEWPVRRCGEGSHRMARAAARRSARVAPDCLFLRPRPNSSRASLRNPLSRHLLRLGDLIGRHLDGYTVSGRRGCITSFSIGRT